MSILIACESSGVVRDAFRRRGHDAVSCDLLPDDNDTGPHIVGDALDAIYSREWDLIIAHPTCTYLTNSAAWAFGDGPYHQRVKPGTLVGAARREAREQALWFVRQVMMVPCQRVCIENPAGCIGTRLDTKAMGFLRHRIQPHQFGHDASKATDLWLRNLPPLRPTEQIEPRMVDGRPRWGNQTDSGQNRLSPSDDRWKTRSRTYEGVAAAMAEQWGKLL